MDVLGPGARRPRWRPVGLPQSTSWAPKRSYRHEAYTAEDEWADVIREWTPGHSWKGRNWESPAAIGGNGGGPLHGAGGEKPFSFLTNGARLNTVRSSSSRVGADAPGESVPLTGLLPSSSPPLPPKSKPPGHRKSVPGPPTLPGANDVPIPSKLVKGIRLHPAQVCFRVPPPPPPGAPPPSALALWESILSPPPGSPPSPRTQCAERVSPMDCHTSSVNCAQGTASSMPLTNGDSRRTTQIESSWGRTSRSESSAGDRHRFRHMYAMDATANGHQTSTLSKRSRCSCASGGGAVLIAMFFVIAALWYPVLCQAFDRQTPAAWSIGARFRDFAPEWLLTASEQVVARPHNGEGVIDAADVRNSAQGVELTDSKILRSPEGFPRVCAALACMACCMMRVFPSRRTVIAWSFISGSMHALLSLGCSSLWTNSSSCQNIVPSSMQVLGNVLCAFLIGLFALWKSRWQHPLSIVVATCSVFSLIPIILAMPPLADLIGMQFVLRVFFGVSLVMHLLILMASTVVCADAMMNIPDAGLVRKF